MNIEAAAIGAASGFLTACIAIAGFWANRQTARSTLTERVTRCEEAGDAAIRAAAEVDNDMKDFRDKHSAETRELHVKIEAVNSTWVMKWEAALREFVGQPSIDKLEKRLMDANAASEERMTTAINNLVQRVDRVIAGGK